MKMVKSLLLGSAAGLVAVAGAQAADLPVKAKPVQYVKICSLYGAGFYYIPGTDMCLKIGGWTRFEAAYGTNNSSVGTWASDVNNRTTNNTWYRVRGYITADAREQTAYGVARAYIAVGLSTSSVVNVASAANQFDANRAFIQWAGFTFGRTQSFYELYSSAAVGYFGWAQPNADTGDSGWDLAAYTAQFGNGWSATISAENSRRTQIINANGPVGAPGSGSANGVLVGAFNPTVAVNNAAGAYGGWNVPDIVGNLRVDQAWGSAQVMGALHQVNTTYYTGSTSVAGSNPSNEWGFVVGAGVKINFPMFGPGDWMQLQTSYTQGALRYLNQTEGTAGYYMERGTNVGFGVVSDAVFGGTATVQPTNLNLTTAWGFNGSYEHFWAPDWRTSLYGWTEKVTYNSQANAMLCAAEAGQATITGGVIGAGTVAAAGCNNNFTYWGIGSRTQWNITKTLYMGVDVAYGKIQSATSSLAGNANPVNASATGCAVGGCTVSNTDNWGARFRVHKDFYP
jgi:Porin subfamily